MFWLELQARYVCRLLALMIDERVSSATVKAGIHDAYNQLIDDEHAHMIWTHPGMRTYYRNEAGRVVFVSPFRNVDFWDKLRKVDLAEYDCTSMAAEVTAGVENR
jgi:4-hydroxyacetophenone monooxygenase